MQDSSISADPIKGTEMRNKLEGVLGQVYHKQLKEETQSQTQKKN